MIAIFITSIITFILISIIFFSNSPEVKIGERIHFQSKDGNFSFTAIPSKGINYVELEKAFSKYKIENKISDEAYKVYRVTRKNYLKISKWCQYKTMPEWQYPLK